MDGYEFERAEIAALERVVGDPGAKAMSLTFSLLRRITNDFSDDYRIGCGAFSVVYKGVLPSGLQIAVKKLYSLPGLDESAFENEVFTTMRVAHQNVVRLVGYCSHTQSEIFEYNGKSVFAEAGQRLICTEYVPDGILDKYITDEFHGGLDWNHRYKVLKGICHGLHYLHDEVCIVHRDIKESNILLGDNLVPKIFDFGFSTSLRDGESSTDDEGIQGTIGYMAPELITERTYSFKSDIFSLGVVMMKLLIGSTWASENRSVELILEKLRKRLVKGAFSSWENNYHQVRTCLQIVYSCMDMDPDERPTALEIIQRLDETESTDYSVSSGHAPPLWQEMKESDSSDVDDSEPERTPSDNILPSDDEPASADMTGETSTQEADMPDLLSKLSLSAELSSLDFLEKITDGFSHERIIGKDGPHAVYHKAFVYEGNISGRTMVAVKRLIGVAIPVTKFEMDAKQLMSLDHKNIVKLLGYCHDESRGHKLVTLLMVENNWRQDSQIATLYGSLEDKLREQVKMCIDIGLHCVKSNPGDRPTAGEIMLWLDKGSKLGVARPQLRATANVTHADDHIQEKEKQTPFRRFFRRK